MKIGIIIHSFTGNTFSIAQKLHDSLTKAGHVVNLEQIKLTGGEQPNMKDFKIEIYPDISPYDALIFGAPVRGFSLSPVMRVYLEQLVSLQDKKLICFVTQFFPYQWMGGNRAITQFRKACGQKRGTVCSTGIANWKNKSREKKITEMVEEFCKLF
ncbi:MAG: flavodoxin domain-containing protein [Clostridia bacterium]|nr:flavodoxin domain-containing protein [Clostridia bacterium]